jgi:hypothetical protein
MLFDQRDAQAIVRKLKGTIQSGHRKHDIAVITFAGKNICHFGIRRGSGSVGHDYIPGQIHVTPKEARLLVQCPMSLDDWVVLMKRKNIIADDSAAAAQPRKI